MAHPKGLLMERLKKQGVAPEFRTANTGPDHEPTFLTDVVVNGEVLGTGQGGNKRESERLASEEALAFLDRNPLELEAVAPASSHRTRQKESEQRDSPGPAKTGARKGDASTQPKKGSQKADVGTQPKKGGQTAATANRSKKSGVEAAPMQAEYDDGRFEGPWPVFENLLAGIVEVAGGRVDEGLKGEEARIAVRDFTLELYKDLLEDLGDVVEEDDEE